MRRYLPLLATPLLLVAAACAPADNTSAGSSTAPSTSPSANACSPANLQTKQPGILTVATDTPAYDPWFSKNDPSNGKGFESAVAYAVANQLGYSKAKVRWTKEPFNNSYTPGAKNFDFDINEISITPARAKVVDFSSPYYSAAQAVVALKGQPITRVTSIAELAKYQLGAQTGTTSLLAIQDVVKPAKQPRVFDTTNDAKQALLNHQIDGFLADLPTAFYITAAQIPHSKIVGQFEPLSNNQDQFGLLFEKGSPLVSCVNKAIAALKSDGSLASIQQRWLSNVVNVPVLK